jgi:hypothetical protein
MKKSYYDEIYNQDFQPQGNDAHGWIQWKGTDVCMDTHCKCGYHGHVDVDFFYHYECPECHRKYAVGQNVKLIEMTQEQIDNEGHDFYSDEIES